MKIIIVAALLVFSGVSFGEDLVTIFGKKYENYKVQRAEPDGLMIMHSAGISKVPFKELPEEIRKEYGYSESKAKEFAKEEARRQYAIRSKMAAKNAELERQAEAAKVAEPEPAKTKPKTQTRTVSPLHKAAEPVGGHAYTLKQVIANKIDLDGRVIKVTNLQVMSNREQISPEKYFIWMGYGNSVAKATFDREGAQNIKNLGTYYARIDAKGEYLLTLVGSKLKQSGLSGPKTPVW